MGKINILIVGMSPETGGIENFIFQFVTGANKDNFRFDILTFCSRCAYENELAVLGCKVFHAARRGKNPVKNYLDQRRFFAQNPTTYDFIWLHLSSASDLKTILLAKRYTGAKIACHCHGTDFESREGFIRKLHLHLHYKNKPKLIKNTDLYLACSKLAGDWLYGDIGERLTVIPNGIDVPAHRFDRMKRTEMRRGLGVEDKIVLGHAGRLTKVKNQAYLIDIFASFYEKHPDAVLMIAGTGELENDLREKVRRLALEDQVFFMGFRKDMPDLFQAFDVFLLPSYTEGLPITIVEAQACGLPCVISDTITREVALTDLVHFLSISQPPGNWVKEIEEALRCPRVSSDYEQKIIESGYSSQGTVDRLSNVFGG